MKYFVTILTKYSKQASEKGLKCLVVQEKGHNHTYLRVTQGEMRSSRENTTHSTRTA